MECSKTEELAHVHVPVTGMNQGLIQSQLPQAKLCSEDGPIHPSHCSLGCLSGYVLTKMP